MPEITAAAQGTDRHPPEDIPQTGRGVTLRGHWPEKPSIGQAGPRAIPRPNTPRLIQYAKTANRIRIFCETM